MDKDLDKEQVAAFMKGMLFGMVLGGLGGVLFAPKAGKETRNIIKKKVLEAQKKVGKEAGKFGDYVKDHSDEIVEKVKRASDEIRK